MNMNPLNDYPAVRKALYLVQWVVNGIVAVLSAYFAFADGTPDDWPKWFLGVLAVAPVLWTYLGITAQSNTSPDQPPVSAAGGEVTGVVSGNPDLGPDEDESADESLLYGDGADRGAPEEKDLRY